MGEKEREREREREREKNIYIYIYIYICIGQETKEGKHMIKKMVLGIVIIELKSESIFFFYSSLLRNTSLSRKEKQSCSHTLLQYIYKFNFNLNTFFCIIYLLTCFFFVLFQLKLNE